MYFSSRLTFLSKASVSPSTNSNYLVLTPSCKYSFVANW